MRRRCARLLLIFCAFQIGKAHSEDAGGGHHRIRVTPDYESVGGTLTSELNVYGGALYNDIFIDYLTHDGWSIGVSTLNMPIQGGHGARGDQYDTYLNVARFFVLSPELILAIGSQNGYGLGSETKSFHNFTFAKGTYEIDGWVKLSSGTYYVNNALSESYQNVGALVAVDFEYINDVLWTEIEKWTRFFGQVVIYVSRLCCHPWISQFVIHLVGRLPIQGLMPPLLIEEVKVF